ncbi:hypothetical protein PsYK624_131490 [Phanerochaete sordida]|uniref:Uncharacterized protein n=1 Tax=Phanerochaete sordida TaxID=48140 RepID=A0A9P3LJ23_9APHY|nr:hypothetical protein PsYK624_131490 [Phanerochaete sordida]
MNANAAGQALRSVAVYASADMGHAGQSLRDALLRLSVGRCEFFSGAWAVHADASHPSITPLLDTLSAIPDERRCVEHVFIEQTFGPAHDANPQERERLIALEKTSIVEMHLLLELLAPTLQTLAIVRSSIDPADSSLRGGLILKGLHFPALRELAIAGPPETTVAFDLPLSPKLAPSLRRLQVPSDMLLIHQAAMAPYTVPHLAHLVVSPLRPRCTPGQLEALRKYGSVMGVFVADGKAAALPSRAPAQAEPCVEIAVFSSLDSARAAEVGRIHWEVLGWMKPAVLRDCLKFKDVQGEVEPTYEEALGLMKGGWLERRGKSMLG